MKSFLHRSGQGLLIVGALALGYALLSLVRADSFQAYQNWVFERSLETGANFSQTSVPKPHSVVGRLEVPSLDLSVMILEGVEESELQLGAGHVPGTDLPGGAGNVVIAGHRDTFFRPLRELRRNDILTLTTLGGSERYVVESMRITRPDDLAVLERGPEPVLTLITCYPFSYIGSAPERFVVRARKLG